MKLLLSHGTTAFRTYGPVSAPAIILVHGATLGSMTYQDYAAPFVAAGFRVVLYDQYGRGFSDRPRAPFSIDLMRAQLAELMDHLEIERAHLYGVSLGGAIVTRFAAAHPDRVQTLGLQVPLIGGANVRAMCAARLPLVGPLLAGFTLFRRLLNAVRVSAPKPKPVALDGPFQRPVCGGGH